MILSWRVGCFNNWSTYPKKGLMRPYQGKPIVNKPAGYVGGGRLTSHNAWLTCFPALLSALCQFMVICFTLLLDRCRSVLNL